MKHDVIFMRLEEMPSLLLEAGEIGLTNLRQFVFDAVSDLVGKVRINNRLSGFFDVLHKIAQTQSYMARAVLRQEEAKVPQVISASLVPG